MPAFERPPPHAYSAPAEIARLNAYLDANPNHRVPARDADHLLLGSWNIANLGDPAQARDDADLDLIADILSRFDMVAVQEVKRDLEPLMRIIARMPGDMRLLFTDVGGGNVERMVFLYDGARIAPLEMTGEVAIAPGNRRYITIEGIAQKFDGFDRNPMVGSFRCGALDFMIANAHLYFGSSSKRSENRRALEAYALGRWADLETRRATAYVRNAIVLGDLNMPRAEPGDPIHDALTKRGLVIPPHGSRVGTTLANVNEYDQIAFLPGDLADAFVDQGVLSFDNAVFPEVWDDRGKTGFDAFLRYHISDHRPIWMRFRTA